MVQVVWCGACCEDHVAQIMLCRACSIGHVVQMEEGKQNWKCRPHLRLYKGGRQNTNSWLESGGSCDVVNWRQWRRELNKILSLIVYKRRFEEDHTIIICTLPTGWGHTYSVDTHYSSAGTHIQHIVSVRQALTVLYQHLGGLRVGRVPQIHPWQVLVWDLNTSQHVLINFYVLKNFIFFSSL